MSSVIFQRRCRQGSFRRCLVAVLAIISLPPLAVLSKPEPITLANTTLVIKRARANLKTLTRDDAEGLRQLVEQLGKADREKEKQQLLHVICETKFATAEDFCDLGDMYADITGESGPAKLAQKYYEQALKIDPDYSKAYGLLAEMALIENQKDKALKYSTRGLACKRRDEHTFKMHANVLATMKRYKEALASLNQAEKEVEMGAEMYRVKGSILENLGRFDEAIASYRKSLLRDYSDWASFQIVHCLETQKKYAAAVAELDKILLLNPKDDEAYRHRAKVKRQMKDYKGALKDLNSAIDLEPTTKSLRERAMIYEQTGHKDLARKDMQEINRIMNEPF